MSGIREDMQEGFVSPPDHIGFAAKRLFGACGEIIDGAIACIEPGGGGPTRQHTHRHDHLFVVMQGEAVIHLDDDEIVLHLHDAYLVRGSVPHSVENRTSGTVVMLGISVHPSPEH